MSVASVGFTVKLNVTIDPPLAPDTETHAVCSPGASPAFGLTVKVLEDPTGIFVIKVVLSVKLFAFAPDSETVRFPVGWLPVLDTTMLRAAGAV